MPDFLRFDSRGNPFLHYDSSFEDNERFFIFSSVFKKKYFEKVKVLVIDGTFKSSAQEFNQVVIIHGFIFCKTYPLIYALLSDKTELSYIRSFKKCIEIFNLKPRTIITDFERALINGTKASLSALKTMDVCPFSDKLFGEGSTL
jgi:hypothetical protein